MSNQPSTSNAQYQRLQWSDDSSDDDEHNRERLCTTPIDGIPQETQSDPNPSSGESDLSESSNESGSDHEEVQATPQRRGPGRPRKCGVKTQNSSNTSAQGANHLESSEGSGSDHEEVEDTPQRHRPGRPRKYGVKTQNSSEPSAPGEDQSEHSEESGSDHEEVEAPPQRRGPGRPRKYGVKTKDGSKPRFQVTYQSESSEENESDDDETPSQRRGPGRPRKYDVKTQNSSEPSAQGADHSEETEGNESDQGEVEVTRQWRRGRPRKDEVKSRAQLQARSKSGRFAKKPKAKPTSGLSDLPSQGDVSDSEEESTSQPQIRSKKGRFAKKPRVRATPKASGSDGSDDEEELQPPKKKKAKLLTAEQIRYRERQNKLNKQKNAQWDAAVALQAARDQERTAKRERPLNRYILERPPTPEPDSDEEPKVPPPPPTEAELAAILAKKQERHRLYEEGKAKREEERAKKREKERLRRLFPSKNPKRGGTFEGCPSTRTTDRSGNPSTTWEDWKRVFYVDAEARRKEFKMRKHKQIRKLKPRTGPPPNKGMFAVESRRLLEKKEDSGFHHVAHRTQKKEETDSEEEESDNQDPPKNRNHSAKVRDFLKKEFEERIQYLDEESIKRIMGKAKLSRKQVISWFANTRRKVQQQFKKGEISKLPDQMAALEKMNKERTERGEYLKLRDPVEEESDEKQEDLESDEEESSDSDDTESEEDEDDDEGTQRVAVRNLEWLSTEGYPVFPGEKPYRKTQNNGL